MIKTLFFNPNTRDYMVVQQALVKAQIDFEPFPVTGRNVSERLKTIGINRLPALYIRNDRNIKILIGQEIFELLQQYEVQEEEEEESVPFRYRAKQTYARSSKPKKKTVKYDSSEEIESSIGSEEIISDEQESIIISEDQEEQIENDKGKINAQAAMKAFQEENEKLLPPEEEERGKRRKRH